MHCPDCGAECGATGTDELGKNSCYDCRGCEAHWSRRVDTIEYLFPWDSDDKCDICGSKPRI